MDDAETWREAEGMKDILLDRDGDIHVGPESDIDITDSVVQAIRVRLLWFLGECVLYPRKQERIISVPCSGKMSAPCSRRRRSGAR